jgi:hypothetical protein
MASVVQSKVDQLTSREDGCYIKLRNPQHQPENGFFHLVLDHPNYNALFSLASMAAMSERPLTIVTQDAIVPTEEAEVKMLSINF